MLCFLKFSQQIFDIKKTMEASLTKITFIAQVKAFARLIRFNNLLIIGLTQYMIKICLIDEPNQVWANFKDPSLFMLASSTILIAAAGYIINDYYDVKIDTINKPKRIVIGKYLKRRVALAINFGLNLLGLGLAWMLSYKVFALTFISGFLLWWYSNQLKRLPLAGNAMIALLTAISVLVMAVYYPQNQDLLVIFAVFAFFITLVRELVKDMEDVQGDAHFGCQTLPIVWGVRRTKNVIYVFLAIFVIILLSTYLSFPRKFAFYLYLVVLPPLTFFFVRLLRADTRKEFAFLSYLCKWIMVLGVLSMGLV